MKLSTTFRSWAFAALALLALGACNREWDANRPGTVGAGPAGMAAAQDAMGMAAAAGVRGAQPGTAAAARPAFASLPDRGDLFGYPRDRVVRREGAYTWHRTDVSEEHALRAIVDGELRITAPDGSQLAFEYERHVEHPTGDWTWVGRLRDAPPGRQAILTFGARAVFGSIAQAVSEPLRLTMRDSASWLVETDPALAAAVEAQVLRPESPDFLVPPLYFGNPAAPSASGGSATTGASAGSVEGSSSTASSTTTVVDVLVGFTPGFATYHGGDSAARTRINFLVDVANQGYINSQIDARVRLVHAMPVNYPDATNNGETLEKMTGYKSGTGKTTPDPVFSEMRNARETYGADLVTLIRKFNTPENDGCGIAWLIGGGLTTISQGHEYFGYSVVGDGIDQGTDGKNYFCREETMVHEFGHNMGSAHDIETAKGDDGVLQTKEYGRYTYSFGYRTGPGAGDFYTIMAYREKRETGTQQQPYRVFSNPNITFCGGFACGTSNADNTRSLGNTVGVISSFRASTSGNNVALVPHDMNGDGRSDLVWTHAAGNTLALWFVDGVTVTSTVGYATGGEYAHAATFDFTRNGRNDLLLSNNQGGYRLWANNGRGFDAYNFPAPSPAWKLIGAGAINGRAEPGIIWFSREFDSIAYWKMDGANIVGWAGFGVSPNETPIAVGDYNADGRLDVVIVNTESAMSILLGDGTGFVKQDFSTFPEGWHIVSSYDLNGDGASDLIWRSSAGHIAFWYMSGATVVQAHGYGLSPDYQLVGIGDYDGNGLGDLLFKPLGSRMHMWLSRPGQVILGWDFVDFPMGWHPGSF